MAYDIEQAAQILADNVNGFETRTLQRIGRRIKQIGQLNSADVKALENMTNIGIPLEEIYADLAAATELNIKEVEHILSEHMTAEMERTQAVFKARGIPFVSYPENEFAQQMVKHWAEITAGEMINLSRTKAIGFTKTFPNGRSEFIPIEGAFQSAIDKAVVSVRTGTADFAAAMRDTVEELGGSSIVVNYGSGVTRRLDSMVRQNLLYGAKQSAQAYHNHVGEQLGADGFEVDYHPHPRPSHEVIGGQIFALGDKDVTVGGVTYISAEKDLEGSGSALKLLDDYGCLHFATPFFLGISQPRYDEKWLAEQKAKDKEIIEYTTPAGKVIKGTRYDFTQKQRALERGARKAKRKEMTAKAAGNNTLAKEARGKAKAFRSAYDDLCGKTGLQPTPERMAVSGDACIIVDNSVKNSIINLNRTIKRRESNTGAFYNLGVPMQKRSVLRTAEKYGISTEGLAFKIQRSEKLLALPFYGSVDYNNVGRIDLFPNAFINDEQLIRTILHEKCHIEQLQKYGKVYAQQNIDLMEKQAERFENLYYKILKKRVK